jgi:hypothetical protein
MMEKRFRKPQRVVIYVKDIELITGRKPGAARNLYLAIMRSFEKRRGQFITFQEFSIYTGIDEEMIQQYLQS